jgi:hypothetical protein
LTRQPARRGRPRKFVHVFGESVNDSDSIRELLLHLNPRLDGRIKRHPRPVSLVRQAGPDAVKPWVAGIRDVVETHSRRHGPPTAVLVHRDADRPDPNSDVHRQLNQQLTSIPGEPVVPVQMIEAWWFLFPGAVEAVKPIAGQVRRLALTPQGRSTSFDRFAELARGLS